MTATRATEQLRTLLRQAMTDKRIAEAERDAARDVAAAFRESAGQMRDELAALRLSSATMTAALEVVGAHVYHARDDAFSIRDQPPSIIAVWRSCFFSGSNGFQCDRCRLSLIIHAILNGLPVDEYISERSGTDASGHHYICPTLQIIN